MPVKFSHLQVKLLTMCGILLLLFIFLRKRITMSKGNDLYSLLLKNGFNVNLAKWAMAQAAHETGNFTSNIFILNNNCYGMKYAGQSTALGEKNGYAYYNNIEESAIDLIKWYTRRRNNILSLPLYISNITDYVKFLKNNRYFEADETEYLNGCKYFLNLYFPNEKS